MSDALDTCDYCLDRKARLLRFIGFADLLGTRKPLVKLHCGEADCVPNDEIDSEALAAFLAGRSKP